MIESRSELNFTDAITVIVPCSFKVLHRYLTRLSLNITVADVLYFNGSAMIKRDLTEDPITSRRDSIQFRFRTNRADGVLLYSHGSQGDILALQLINNRMLLNIDLGSGLMTSLSVGSLLDDNLWHDVRIFRNKREVVFTVDRVMIREKVKGDYAQLDLNRNLYIGGVPNFQEGLVVRQNFTGCIENMFFNYTNVVRAVKDRDHEDFEKFRRHHVLNSCPQEPVVPITFLTANSYAKLPGYEGVNKLNISLDFRTFEENGLLAYHRFTSPGYVKMFLDTGKLKGTHLCFSKLYVIQYLEASHFVGNVW